MLLSRSELEDLASTYDETHVSIYLPTHKAGDEVVQNSVRFKKLLGQAEKELVESGLRRPAAEELLRPAQGLLGDELFWQQQSDGLALFIADGFAQKYRLPLKFEDLVVVGDRFHVKPLLELLSNNGRFYVLALSQHETRLLQGTRHQIGEINLDEIDRVPDSIVEVLKWEDPERRLQAHTGGEKVLDGGVPAMFHGHGLASEDDPKEKIRRYFQRVDQGISDLLGDDVAPLVLAADGFLLPLYREANSYPNLAEKGIAEQPARLDAAELHRRASPIAQPVFTQAQERAEAVYWHLSGTEDERVSGDIEEIAKAATFGRVDGLFVAKGEQQWGAFEEATGAVELHGERRPVDRDILDVAAVQTMLHEGWLFFVDNHDVPGDGPLAAVFRW